MPPNHAGRVIPAVEIRFADLRDVPELAVLFQAYRSFYRISSTRAECREFLRARITRGESVIFVAEAGTAAVAGLCGFTQLYPIYSSLSGGRVWMLNDLYVRPRARGFGIGGRLLERASEHGRSTRAHSIALMTQRTNRVAKALYESVGYELDRRFDRYELHLRPLRGEGVRRPTSRTEDTG